MVFDLFVFFRLGDVWSQIQKVRQHKQGEVTPHATPRPQCPPPRQPQSPVSRVTFGEGPCLW